MTRDTHSTGFYLNAAENCHCEVASISMLVGPLQDVLVYSQFPVGIEYESEFSLDRKTQPLRHYTCCLAVGTMYVALPAPSTLPSASPAGRFRHKSYIAPLMTALQLG